MSEEKKIQEFSEKTYKNPITQATLTAIDTLPVIGVFTAAGRKAMEQVHANAAEERRCAYLDELEKGGVITREMLETEEFIHSVFITYSAAMRTYQRGKIRRFARILLTAIERKELASDAFEEYVKICEQLSEIELLILKAMLESEKHIGNTKGVSQIKELWKTFQEKINSIPAITSTELQHRILRLESYGLYQTVSLGLTFGGSREITGRTTQLFKDFSEWIKLENEKLNAYG